MRKGYRAFVAAALCGAAFLPGVAAAQIATPGQPGQSAPVSDPKPAEPAATEQAIVPDEQFEATMPRVEGDLNAPLSALPEDAITPIATEAPEFQEPLPPIATFDVAPLPADNAVADEKTVTLRYTVATEGLDELGLRGRFRSLSALEKGDGKAANAAMISARAREDEKLALRLMQSLGYYDATAVTTLEQDPAGGPIRVLVSASPGTLYKLGKVEVVSTQPMPPGLVMGELALKSGDPIDAERVQGAEANVSVKLPQQGYPFLQLGERDIVLDDETHLGDYTLPVELGPRSSFGGFVVSGEKQVFKADHVQVLSRFKRGELYDSRKVDDLREALIATSLFSSVSVEPEKTGEIAPDGTEYVNLHVRQQAGPPRTIAGTLGYSTGEGFRAEGSWTHRNLFPPEGALILTAVLGTQEQGASATFRRSNAGKRDRTVQLTVSANHSNYDAYTAYTGTISGRISRDSTPIWQKKWTWYYGAEIVGSNEDRYNFSINARDRGTWLIAAAPLFLGYDASDNLLNPTRGFRIKGNASPEASVRGGVRPYARLMVEGTAYYPVSDSIVIAGRARAGTIVAVDRDDLPPSRRYYAGGGGSVRGFAYQELGPKSPDGKPVGGRGLTEFALEARYRFGDYGIVPFIDAGQVNEGSAPTLKGLRFGAGIGGRLYTNFGPIRIDVATPIKRRAGEAKVALYISIGQAF